METTGSIQMETGPAGRMPSRTARWTILRTARSRKARERCRCTRRIRFRRREFLESDARVAVDAHHGLLLKGRFVRAPDFFERRARGRIGRVRDDQYFRGLAP